MEVDEDGDLIPAADLPARAELVRIPNLYADYLWPFAGGAHPKNRGAFALPGGPFPAEHGDRFLDKMVSDGVAPEEAIKRYLAVDIVKEGELDDRLTDRLDIMRRLDSAGGYDLAGYVEENFRSSQLFRTRQRVTMPLLRRLVDQFFAKLGVQNWTSEKLRRVLFPAGAQPVHPGVIAHFGLTWAQPGQRTPLNDEGYFTFEDFCRRYMGFVWNETLHRGIQTAKTDPAASLADLEAGLKESPESPLGQLARQAARRALGLGDGAVGPDILIDDDSYDPAEESWPGSEPASPAAEAEAEAPAAPEVEPEAVAEPAPVAVTAPEPEPEPAPEPVSAPAEPAHAEQAQQEALLDAPAPEPKVAAEPAPAAPASEPESEPEPDAPETVAEAVDVAP